MEELEYGKWATVNGVRRMIVSWNEDGVELFSIAGNFWVGREYLSEISDFHDTDEEREAKGYAF